MIRRIGAFAAFAVCIGLLATSRPAAAVEYVKICSAAQVPGWFYIPGSDTCVNVDTGATENFTTHAVGQTALAARVQELEEQSRNFSESSAIGMAMPTPVIDQGHNFAFAGNWAQLDGASALAVAAAMRVNTNLSFSAGVGLGMAQGNVGTKVGFNLSW